MNRIHFYRNPRTCERQFNHDVIRHNGTVQHLFWIGPLFVVIRNRRSADAIRSHALLNDGAI